MSLSCDKILNNIVCYRTHCRLGAMAPVVPGQITVREHMTPFKKTTGSMKLSGEV